MMGNKLIRKMQDFSIKESQSDISNKNTEKINLNNIRYNTDKLLNYPTLALNMNLIIPILIYLNDQEFLMDALVLNKKVNERLKSRLIKEKKDFKCDKNLPGRQNMNEVYCEFDMKDYFVAGCVPEIQILVESKDQGRASVSGSSSWIELKFINKLNNSKKVFDIGRNFKEKDFKQLILKLDKNSKGKNLEILQEFNDVNNTVQVVARSAFPGWICCIRKAEFDFKYFYVDRKE